MLGIGKKRQYQENSGRSCEIMKEVKGMEMKKKKLEAVVADLIISAEGLQKTQKQLVTSCM